MEPHRPEPEEHWHNRQFDEHHRQEIENMTPKEKAWVILCELNNAFVSKTDWQNSTEYAKKELKRKAFYLVSEIIDSKPLLPITRPVGSHGENIDNSNKYWVAVKQELENL